MKKEDYDKQGISWRSPFVIVLLTFGAVAGLLLAIEHRAHIFTNNGFLVLLLGLCIGMHFFMHGSHGGHGGHHRAGRRHKGSERDDQENSEDTTQSKGERS